MRIKAILFALFTLGSVNVLASSSPEESQDIICHGTDCYPRIFEASDVFQNVREDQILPKGLHVRMDFHTGLKEAKLYDGIDDENLQAVEVFRDETRDPEPVHSPAEGFEFLQSGMQQVLHPGKTDQGAIRPPISGSDGLGFASDTATIKSASATDESLLPALENLEDVSHDIYWGLQVGQDGEMVHKLNSFIGNTSLNFTIRSTAALLLGTAIQNNPAALTAALSHFYNDSYPDGPLETVMLALIHEQIPAMTIRLVYLISELCQDQQQLLRFIRGDGLAIFRMLFDAGELNPETTYRLRQKISNFVLDHFLQEDSLRGMTAAEPTTNTHAKIRHEKLDEKTWTIVDTAGARKASETSDLLDARSSLSRWCEAFSTSLDKSSGETSVTDQETLTARQHIAEALEALDSKLKVYGCDCTNPKSCQKHKRR